MMLPDGPAKLHCRRIRGAALLAGAVLALAPAAPATPRSADPPVDASVIGRLEPGGTGHLAVRWDGLPGTLADVWVDLDGNGVPAPNERVVAGRSLTSGTEVIPFGVPLNAREDTVRTVWLEVGADGRHVMSRGGGPAAEAGTPITCAWQAGFAAADLDGGVFAMAVFDDGSGPALFVGGDFLSADGILVNYIARWDGTTWSPLFGPSGAGLTDPVHSLAVFDDGSGPALYAGGWFGWADGVNVHRIARWDGTTWSPLSGTVGTGTSGPVYSLAVFDDGDGPALYAGGSFATAGGVTANSIARWDGTSWSALGGPSAIGVDDQVFALSVFDDGSGSALYAGGEFTTAGGVTVNGIGRWDGSVWSPLSGPLGTGISYGSVKALCVFDEGSGPGLYVTGSFAEAGGVEAHSIARWDGSTWSPLSGPPSYGLDHVAYALAIFEDGSGPALFVGGTFATAGGVTVNTIARWDGTTWSALAGPAGTGTDGGLRALTVFDDGTGPALYAGGYLSAAGGIAANNIARWEGYAWSALPGPPDTGLSDDARALAAFDDGPGSHLYAGGFFSHAGGVPVNQIARWDGSTWSALAAPGGTGVGGVSNPDVRTLAVHDDGFGPALYVGGYFTTAGGLTVNGIALWDGTAWSALAGPAGVGTSGAVRATTVFDDGTGPALYAGGYFLAAGGVQVNHVARWDRVRWYALAGPSATGMDSSVNALAVFDDGTGAALYAGGRFTTAGGVTVNGVARWSGTSWSALSGPSGTGVGGPTNPHVDALAVYDDGSGPALYAGGYFFTAGGVTVNHIARWDGTGWSALIGPSGTGISGSIYALAAIDDGRGPALFAGGNLGTAGGETAYHIARWDGTGWSALVGPSGTGVNGASVRALAAHDDGAGPALYAGGWFRAAGGVPSSNLAFWRCSTMVFIDGFDTGSTNAWSLTVP